MRSKRQILEEGIINLSVANTWDRAVEEWYLLHIYWVDDPETCLCTHHPILELCILRNQCNGEEALVGNVCVHRFMGIPSDKVFQGVRRLTENRAGGTPAAVAEHAHKRKWITDWERKFCDSTRGKRRLSTKQRDKRWEINSKIVKRIRRPKYE